jgi:uncharacterized membrane protein
MFTTLFVAARVVANPLSNVFQKELAQRGANPIFIIAATHALLSVAAIPILAAHRVELVADFWWNMAISTLLAVSSNVLLVSALRLTDLSVLGPVNSYKAVISLGLGTFLLGEVPTWFGAAGVFLILVGSCFIVDRAPDQPRGLAFAQFFRDRGVHFRMAALVLSATEAIFLKRAIWHSSPAATFLFWSILGLPVATAAAALLPRGTARKELMSFRQHWRSYVSLAFTTGVMQAATLFTFGKLQVGYSLALFQLSTLISVLLGYHYFAERNIGRRLVASAIMVVGAALIVSLGRA